MVSLAVDLDLDCKYDIKNPRTSYLYILYTSHEHTNTLGSTQLYTKILEGGGCLSELSLSHFREFSGNKV